MRAFVICLLTGLLLFAGPLTSSAKDYRAHIVYEDDYCDGHTDFDFVDGSLIIEHDNRRFETVEITEDYELYVNGKHVETTEEQKLLLADFYHGVEELVDEAMLLGKDGVKVGLAGAKLGIGVLGKLFKMLFTSYDSDDLERDVEREAAKIEAKAAVLEERAEEIEDRADELDYLARKLRRE
ncbi:MAG: hypothetical protein JSU65_03955, partial [Candidatus Zixiibacteriota bacterium]